MEHDELPSTSSALLDVSDVWKTKEMPEHSLSISEMIEQTANEIVTGQGLSGYIYYEEYGMYYNHESGYFYDSKTSLFYHVSTQQYYYFDSESQSYQVYSNDAQSWTQTRYHRRANKIFGTDLTSKLTAEEVNVTELLFELTEKCAISTQTSTNKRAFATNNIFTNGDEYSAFFEEVLSKKARTDIGAYNIDSESHLSNESDKDSDISDKYNSEIERRLLEEEFLTQAPCIRLMQFSDEATQPTLHIVTITGARFGFDVCADIHLDHQNSLLSSICVLIRYEAKQREDGIGFEHLYELHLENKSEDDELFLNEKAVLLGENLTLHHEDLINIKIKQHDDIFTKYLFLVHLHNGLNTCAGCEPGLYAFSKSSSDTNESCVKVIEKNSAAVRRNRESERRRIMQKIKGDYGLLEDDDPTVEKDWNGKFYVDRSAQRRKIYGNSLLERSNKSSNNGIYAKCEAAPKAGASTTSVVLQKSLKGNQLNETLAAANKTPIASHNKGFQLLKSMGWSEGSGLGKHQQGLSGPIDLVSKTRFGESTVVDAVNVANHRVDPKRQEILAKTKKRYEQANN